jgi:F0F1-type ATP synthase assembly protein I
VKIFTSGYFLLRMGDEKDPRRTSSSGGLSRADFAGVGIQFAAAIIVFLFAGQWVDDRLGTNGLITIAAVFVGAGAAFYNLYRKITAAQRRDDEERSAKGGRNPRDGAR